MTVTACIEGVSIGTGPQLQRPPVMTRPARPVGQWLLASRAAVLAAKRYTLPSRQERGKRGACARIGGVNRLSPARSSPAPHTVMTTLAARVPAEVAERGGDLGQLVVPPVEKDQFEGLPANMRSTTLWGGNGMLHDRLRQAGECVRERLSYRKPIRRSATCRKANPNPASCFGC